MVHNRPSFYRSSSNGCQCQYFACESQFGPAQSDSANLDNVAELMVRTGVDLEEALMVLVPEAYRNHPDLMANYPEVCIPPPCCCLRMHTWCCKASQLINALPLATPVPLRKGSSAHQSSPQYSTRHMGLLTNSSAEM